MKDPLPENISGEKVVVHKVNHQIHWGYVSVAVALVFVVLAAREVLEDRDGEEGDGRL